MMLNKILILLIFLSFSLFSFQISKGQNQEPSTQTFNASKSALEKASRNFDDPGQQRRFESFLLVWQLINDNYFDENFNGVDWNKVKTEFEKRVKETKNDLDFHILLQEMINRLNQSHFVITPPEVIEQIEKTREIIASNKIEIDEKDIIKSEDLGSEDNSLEEDEYSYYGIKINIRVYNGDVVVTDVSKGSTAEYAGLTKGSIIREINEVSLAEFFNSLKKLELFNERIEKSLPFEIKNGFLYSYYDYPVKIKFTDKNDKVKEVVIEREKLEGEFNFISQNYPPLFITFEKRSIDEKIGYIKFNNFALSIVEQFCAAVSEFKDKKALIVDLRGNTGGSYSVLLSLLGFMSDRDFGLGTEVYKYYEVPRIVNSHKKNFKGEIVVLIDGSSLSAAEIFASGLKESNKATIIGEISGGQVLPATSRVLPTGAIFMFPVANIKTIKGEFLEGMGVVPDVQIKLHRESLLMDTDNQLLVAENYIRDYLLKGGNKKDKTTKSNGLPPPPPPKIKATANVKIKPEIEVSNPKIKKKKEHDKAALELIDKYLTAIGGREKLKEIRSYKASGIAVLKQSGAEVFGDFTIYRKAPDKYKEIFAITGSGEFGETFDGEKYFSLSSVQGSKESKISKQIDEVALWANFYEFLVLEETYREIKFWGSYKKNGVPVNLITVKDFNDLEISFVFDVDTNLLVGRTGNIMNYTFSDYREVNGIKFPFKQGRGRGLEIQIEDVELNNSLEDDFFKPETKCFDEVD